MKDGDDEKRLAGDSTAAASLNLRTRRASSHVTTSLLPPFNDLFGAKKPLTAPSLSFCFFAQ